MDRLRSLLDSRGRKDDNNHKDKLAETKRAERDKKEAHKAEQRAEKERREKERVEERAAYKQVRALENPASKRAAKESREAARKELKRESGQVCEHGIWKCKICFPKATMKHEKQDKHVDRVLVHAGEVAA